MVSFRGEKRFKPPLQNRILLFGVLFQISDEHPGLFYMGVPTLGWVGSQKTTLNPWDSVTSDL